MENNSKLKSKLEKMKGTSLDRTLDTCLPAAALAFRAAAKAYTKQATKTKASAIKTLQREGILAKDGGFAKPYSNKD